MNIQLLFQKHRLQPGIVCFFTLKGSPARPERQTYFEYLSQEASAAGLETRIVETDEPELDGLTAGRRFNLGNIGEESVAYIRADENMAYAGYSVRDFISSLTDVLSLERGSVDLTQTYFNDIECCCPSIPESGDFADFDAAPPLNADSEPTLERSSRICYKRSSRSSKRRRVSPDTIEEEAAIDELEEQRDRMMEEISRLIRTYVIQFHEMPPVEKFMHEYRSKFLISADQERPFSPVVVNGNLDIVLPYYNELIIKLTPLPKIIYLLFLIHPEGLRLKDIADYQHELEELYLLVKPGAGEKLARNSIEDLCNPLSESLNQKLSMIRRAIRIQLGREDLVEYYSVGGQRGGIYRLPAASGEVALPGAVSSL